MNMKIKRNRVVHRMEKILRASLGFGVPAGCMCVPHQNMSFAVNYVVTTYVFLMIQSIISLSFKVSCFIRI